LVYIKRIEISGFKSFSSSPVTVKFTKGFNAIVGPNGSGKSNIIDAIQFVLGVKSTKALRLQNLTEVLYKPVIDDTNTKPAEFAKVIIYFDNSDKILPSSSTIVAISREVNKDGKSTYRINGKATTKTQLMTFLQSLGISGESYNIVPQGKIAEIINMSPLDIRVLLEDLAGISTYDEQKEKAMKELEEVNKNLASINVILRESEKKLKILEKEKQDALQYIKLRKKIEKLTSALTLMRIKETQKEIAIIDLKTQEYDNEINNLREQISQLEKKEKELSDFIELQENELGKYRKDLDLLQEKISSLRKEKYETSSELKFKKNELSQLLREKNTIEQKINSLKDRITQLHENKDKLDSKESELKEKLNDLSLRRRHLQDELNKLNEALGRVLTDFKNTNSAIETKRESLLNLNQEFNKISTEYESTKRLLEEFKQSQTDVEVTLEELQEKIVTTKNKISELLSQKNDKIENLHKLEEELENIQGLIKEKQEELERKKLEYNSLLSKRNAYKEINAKLSSQRHATLKVLELRDSKRVDGIIGLVSEIISVPENLRTAIDAALGNRVNNIVTTTDDVALQCIKILKELKIGRATFLPLSRIRPREYRLNNEFLRRPGVIGLAKDLIDYNEQYRPVIELLLGNVLIVEDLEAMKEISKEVHGFRVVTLEGDITEPSGTILGGFYVPRKIDFGLISEEEIKMVEEQISKIKDELNILIERELSLERQKEMINKEIRKLEEEIRELQFTLKSLEKEQKENEERYERVTERLAKYQEKIKFLEQQENELKTTIENMKEEIRQLEEKRKALSETLESSNVFVLNKEIEKLDQEIKELNQEYNDIILKLDRIKNEISNSENLITEYLKRIDEIEKKVDEYNPIIENLQNKISEVESEEQAFVDEYDNLKKNFDDFIALVKRYNNERDTIRRKLDDNKDKINKLHISKERLLSERKNLVNKLQDLKNKIGESQLQEELEEISETMSEEEIMDEVRKLEMDISLLEPINHKAIYQYDEEKARYDEIYENYQKFLLEKEGILNFMRNIEKEKVNVFMRTFRQVNENMKKIFGILSPGGTAFLELENPNDPFTGGIFIKSKPAGKKIINLNAMSGGEKSLTALALIFAIQQYSPAPFYVMDEIDAALDTRNASRVANLIKEFSKKSQFILVTLREVTMSKADRLIGVTQKNGTSKIVLLSFEEAKLALK